MVIKMVVDDICVSCKKCCVNSEFIGLITEEELKVMMDKIKRPIKVNSWHAFPDIYEIVETPCPAFIENKCILSESERPCTCLLFPYRPDFDEVTQEWQLDLAVTKCPGALAFAFHADKAIKLFEQMKKDGRWKV